MNDQYSKYLTEGTGRKTFYEAEILIFYPFKAEKSHIFIVILLEVLSGYQWPTFEIFNRRNESRNQKNG